MRRTFLLPLALLLGCASTDRPVADTPTTPAAMKVERAFDVPALLGLNAEQIVQPLTGTAIRPDHDRTPRELPSGATEALYTYWHDSTALVVSYDPQTLKVNNYFIKTQHGLTADYATLLKLGNISKYDKRMALEPIPSANNPQLYTGLKVVPQVPTAVE